MGNLQALLDRAKSGTYVAPPVRRVHIPKAGSPGETRAAGDSDVSFILHLFATELRIGEKEVRPFLGLGRAHEAERRVQERRVGLRKRAMTSGVN